MPPTRMVRLRENARRHALFRKAASTSGTIRISISTSRPSQSRAHGAPIAAGKQAVGSVKEAVGKVTGDKKTEAEGAAQKAEGKIQNMVGGVKDTVREASRE